MKLSAVTSLALAIGLVGSALSLAEQSPSSPKGNGLLPFETVSWEKAKASTNASKVVLLCLVGEVERDADGELLVGHSTPGRVLGKTLNPVRKLVQQMDDTKQDAPDYTKNISIYIVEGGTENRHEPTRKLASELLLEICGIDYYD